jgi:hypothetical protein
MIQVSDVTRYRTLEQIEQDLLQAKLEGRVDVAAEVAQLLLKNNYDRYGAISKDRSLRVALPRQCGKTTFVANLQKKLPHSAIVTPNNVTRSMIVTRHWVDTDHVYTSSEIHKLRGTPYNLVLFDDLIGPSSMEALIELESWQTFLIMVLYTPR